MKQHWNDKTGRWEPPTKADRFRDMSDKSMAKWITRLFAVSIAEAGLNAKLSDDYEYSLLKLLRQPSEE